jgi:hypothetical protein
VQAIDEGRRPPRTDAREDGWTKVLLKPQA